MEEERKLGKVLATVFALFLCLVMLATTVIPDRSYAASISKKKVTVYVGNTTTLSVKGTKKTVKWKSSNKKVATVSSKGKVTGKKTGTAKITATIGKKKYTCTVTVKKKPAISKKTVTLRKGKSTTLKLNNATAKKVTWSSKNKKVAKVSRTGKVTGVKKGTTTIYAKYNGKKYSCKVTVKGDPKLSKAKLSLTAGKKAKLSLVDAVKSVSWSSSNKKVAKVDKKGNVTAVSAGTAKITAKSNGKSYKCTVTVKKAPAKTTTTTSTKPASASTYSSSYDSGIRSQCPKADACVLNAFEKMGFSVLFNRFVNYSGCFSAADQTITLRDYGSDVAYHELGHFVAFAAINADRTSEFQSVYQAEKSKYTKYNKTYVCSSASDYFAESYKDYILEKSKLKSERPRTYAAIQEAVNDIKNGSWEKVYKVYSPFWK